MNSEGATLFVPVLLIMNMMVTRFFVETTQIKVSKGEVSKGSTLSVGLILVDSIQPKRHKKMSNFFRINLGGQLNQIFLVVVSKIFYLLPWKLGICFKTGWNRQSIGFLCTEKTKDEAAVLAGLPTPPMRRKSLETMVETPCWVSEDFWMFFLSQTWKDFCAGRFGQRFFCNVDANKWSIDFLEFGGLGLGE